MPTPDQILAEAKRRRLIPEDASAETFYAAGEAFEGPVAQATEDPWRAVGTARSFLQPDLTRGFPTQDEMRANQQFGVMRPEGGASADIMRQRGANVWQEVRPAPKTAKRAKGGEAQGPADISQDFTVDWSGGTTPVLIPKDPALSQSIGQTQLGMVAEATGLPGAYRLGRYGAAALTGPDWARGDLSRAAATEGIFATLGAMGNAELLAAPRLAAKAAAKAPQAAQAPGSVAYGDNALSQSVRLPSRDRLDPITQMRLDAEPIAAADRFGPIPPGRERRFGRTGGTIPQQPEMGTPEWDAALAAARAKRENGLQMTRTERDLLRMSGDIEGGGAFAPVSRGGNLPEGSSIGEVRRSGPPDAQARTTSPKDIILGYLDRDSLGEIADNSGYAESGLTVLRQRLQKEAAADPAKFAAKYGVDETTARDFVSAEKLSVGERGADTSDRILDAAERLMRTGSKPSPKAISDMTGISSGTVKVLFSHLRNPEKYGRAATGPRLERFNALQQAVKDKYGANLWAPIGLGAGAGALALNSEAEAQEGYQYPEAFRPLGNNGAFPSPDEIGPTQAAEFEDPEASGDNPYRPLITAGSIGLGALLGRAGGGALGRSRAIRSRNYDPNRLRRFDVLGSAAGGALGGIASEAALDGNPTIGGLAGLGAGYLFGRGADMLGDMRVPGLGSAARNADAMQYADELGQLSAPRTMRVEDARYSVPGPGGTVQVYPLPDDYLEPLPRDVPNPDYGAQLRERFEYAGPGPRTWGLGETGSGASGGRPRSLTEREALMQQPPSITDQRLERRLLLGQRFSTPSEEARRGLSSAPAAFERMPDAPTMTGAEAKRLALQDPIPPPTPPGDVTPPPEPRPTPQVTYAPMDPVPPLRASTGFEGMTPAVTSDVRPPKGPNRIRMEERKSDAARDRYLAAKGKSGAGFSDDELAEAASVVGTDVVTGKNGGVNRAATARAIRERLAAPGDKTLYARLRRAFPDKSLAVLLSAGAGAGAVSQQEDAFAPVR